MISNFYGHFHETVEDALENSKKATGERELGKDPQTGKPVFAKIGRYGPMIQIGHGEDEEKKFASIRTGKSITEITLEEALDCFKLPRDIGMFEGEMMVAGVGRYGPYIRHKGKFVSIGKEDGDPMTIDVDKSIELIQAKREVEAKRLIKSFDEDPDTQVLNGRYGAYIKSGRKNFRIPKDKVAEELTYEEVKEIIESAPDKSKKTTKKKTTKKTTKKK